MPKHRKIVAVVDDDPSMLNAAELRMVDGASAPSA
jgi:hypothetical protein